MQNALETSCRSPLYITCLLPVLLSSFFQACLPKGQYMEGANFVWMTPFMYVQILGLVMENPCDHWQQPNLSIMDSQSFVFGSYTVKFLLQKTVFSNSKI